MYIRDGVPFDINTLHVIDEMQYPVGYFHDADRRALHGVFAVQSTVPPAVTASQKVTLSGYAEVEGIWQETWIVSEKTPTDLAADAATLAQAKLDKNQAINDIRYQVNFTAFPYAGKLIACDPLSRSDIDAVAGHIALFGALPPNFPGAWKAINNTYLPIPDVAAFKAMYQAMTETGTQHFMRSQAMKAELAAATTLAEIAAIYW